MPVRPRSPTGSDSPVDRGRGTRDELAVKLALAATLPGVDVATVIRSQRAASLALLQRLEAAEPAGSGAEELARSLVVDSMTFAAQAELSWLDSVERRLARHPEHAMALELATERPRRGRPASRASRRSAAVV